MMNILTQLADELAIGTRNEKSTCKIMSEAIQVKVPYLSFLLNSFFFGSIFLCSTTDFLLIFYLGEGEGMVFWELFLSFFHSN